MANEYVKKNELKSKLPQKVPYDRYGQGFNDCIDRVTEVIDEAATTDIVHCKECIHRNKPYKCAMWYGMIDRKHYFINHGDDFSCAYGERKNETIL